jgi:predicted amidohydrolase YtcJ
MRIPIAIALLVSFFLAACSSDPEQAEGDRPARGADWVLRGGAFFTVDGEQPWADAVAVDGERFVYVGDDAGADSFITDSTRVTDLGGRLVIPGMVDAHTHPGYMGRFGPTRAILTATTPEGVLEEVREYADAHPDLPWIVMYGFPVEAYDKFGPHREALDRVVPDRPVFLLGSIGHSRWFNTRALELMGVDRNTPDAVPDLSLFVRDAEGELTGWTKEYAVLPYLAPFMERDPEANREGTLRFLDYLSSQGVMSLMDAGNRNYHDEAYSSLAELDRSGRLPVRYEGIYHIYLPEQVPGAIAELLRLRRAYGGDRLRFNTIKIHFDGTNEIRTGAVLEDFSDDPGNRGNTLLDEDELYRFILDLHEEELDLHLHTVGDRAVRIALNAVERAREAIDGSLYTQVTLCHLEVIDAADFPRFRELGVLANYTPWWHGHFENDTTRLSLGSRQPRTFLAQPLFDDGAIVTFSSDVTSLGSIPQSNPFFGIQTAHNRQRPEDGPDAPIRMPLTERLRLEDLVKGYTLNGAIQLRMDADIGSIEAGKLADFVVLDQNLFEIDRYRIQHLEPDAVVMEGRLIHGELN